MIKLIPWLLGPEAATEGKNTHLLPRWIFLRTLGLIYFSAFYSLLFQIKGLIGPTGILPAGEYLPVVPKYFPGIKQFWFAPTLLWFSSSNHALMVLCWVGLLASLAVIFNLWPRAALAACFVCFLSLWLPRRTSPVISQTACCWRRDSSPCSLRRLACG